MATNTTRRYNGVEYTILNKTCSIKSLSTLPQDVPHIFVFVESKPTKYGNYVATVKNEDTGEETRYYMPEYITRNALPDKLFIYNGLEKKSDGSGHSYHSIFWIKRK